MGYVTSVTFARHESYELRPEGQLGRPRRGLLLVALILVVVLGWLVWGVFELLRHMSL
jgi:hypothetical protein